MHLCRPFSIRFSRFRSFPRLFTSHFHALSDPQTPPTSLSTIPTLSTPPASESSSQPTPSSGPIGKPFEFCPKLAVLGVGGAGGNAVNNMLRNGLTGVDFIVANTDRQALDASLAPRRIQLGAQLTRGLGAGARPHIGSKAAEESIDEVMRALEGCHMVFITAGMGGGTGTGAAPVLAHAAKEHGILTVGVVTKPFAFEGKQRARIAEYGMENMERSVDTLVVVPNQNLFRMVDRGTSLMNAFKLADKVLFEGVQSITDLIVQPGLINLDFADVRTVMQNMGKAMIGIGESDGDERAIRAAELAVSNPLLEDIDLSMANHVLLNISGGYDMTLSDVDIAANRVREEVHPDANIIFGTSFSEKLKKRIRVSVLATGMYK
uniref:Mitochondrial FtsZ1 n=1 Tax=Stygiella incarcerata TaxID=1712417 RepID=A0A0E3X1P7_9EUKA|nr:mitochondrial FtsZ1 [Stygiella incarcerata]